MTVQFSDQKSVPANGRPDAGTIWAYVGSGYEHPVLVEVSRTGVDFHLNFYTFTEASDGPSDVHEPVPTRLLALDVQSFRELEGSGLLVEIGAMSSQLQLRV
ncbi:MAG TPA: hypothetical protein VLE72_00020 [Candidatus Saccharimonadales bacterium]|nr:hypothetical protein [Candidatus Saccharimonadales bacterium]